MTTPSRPRILLADDYPGMLAAITRLLEPDCHVVGVVADGDALLEAATRLQPDVVVVDLNLPAVSGIEACRLIRQANANTKVIVFTALTDAGITEEVRAAGASAFVPKYRIGEDLISAIKTACADSEG
jgi:DNA-binding NarL/FixJ family response regulator